MIPVESIVNVLVGAAFLGFWLGAFIILYHLARFGVGVLPKKLAIIFLVGALGIFTWCVVTYMKLDITNIRL